MIDIIFNLFKVKYIKLDKIINDTVGNIDFNKPFNIFINLEPIIKKLSSSNVEEYLRVKTDERVKELISNIINLASHYRLFFTKNKVYSKVYFYYGYPFKSKHKLLTVNPNYRLYYENKYNTNPNYFVLKDVIKTSIPLTKIILDYIEGVYFLTSNELEPSLIPTIIDSENACNNFIITNDRYDFQHTLNGTNYIIVPKQDDSFVVTKNNLISTLKRLEKVETEELCEAEFYPFILSIIGDKYRSIDKLKRVGVSSIISLINKAKEKQLIGNSSYSIDILLKIIKQEHRDNILNNFVCSCLNYQYNLVNKNDKMEIHNQIVDKFDDTQLKLLNEQNFLDTPIQLVEITSALQYKKR